MSQEIDRQELAIRHLLGTLTDDEKTSLEEKYFLNDKEFEELEIAEDELIDRYVRTELSADDSSRFERLLISPRISERVEVARMLVQRTATAPQKQPVPTPAVASAPVEPRRESWWEKLFGPTAVAAPGFRPAMAFALMLALMTTVALVFVWTRLRTQSQQLVQVQQQREALNKQIEEQKARYSELESRLEQTRQQNEEQQQQLAQNYEQLIAEQQRLKPALSFPFFVNPDDGTRGSGGDSAQRISIPSGVSSVSINLNVTHGDYAKYNGIVQNIDSRKQITTVSNLKPFQRQGRKYVTLKLDAKRLSPGSYNVRLNGVKPTGEDENFSDYSFRVRMSSR